MCKNSMVSPTLRGDGGPLKKNNVFTNLPKSQPWFLNSVRLYVLKSYECCWWVMVLILSFALRNGLLSPADDTLLL